MMTETSWKASGWMSLTRLEGENMTVIDNDDIATMNRKDRIETRAVVTNIGIITGTGNKDASNIPQFINIPNELSLYLVSV